MDSSIIAPLSPFFLKFPRSVGAIFRDYLVILPEDGGLRSATVTRFYYTFLISVLGVVSM